MSSRNVYLSKEERSSALTLIGALKLAQKLYAEGERKAAVMIKQAEKLIKSAAFYRYRLYKNMRYCHS